jgi:acetyltransferase
MVDYSEAAGPIFGALRLYAAFVERGNEKHASFSVKKDQAKARAILADSDAKVWGEHVTRPLLEAYGVSLVEGALAADSQAAVEAAEKLGYPVVMKVASQDVLHKSDFGAIAVNIKDDKQLESDYRRIMDNVKSHAPDADIEGVLLEKMAPKGMEVIIGMKRDPSFGPLMMFGMGGVFVELFKDVAFRVAPLTYVDAEEMLKATKAYKLLNGYRGGERYDMEAIIQNLLKLSAVAVDFPQIQEIEINPLLVLPEGQGALALDCRMILE